MKSVLACGGLGALLVLGGSGCVPVRREPAPFRIGFGKAQAGLEHVVVYSPSGRVIRRIEGEEVERLRRLLLAGQLSPTSGPESPNYLPISYSLAFTGKRGGQWSVQLYGRAQRAVMREEGVHVYSRQQRRAIEQIIDKRREWRS